MTRDPAIEAVRDARRQISESVGHDPHRLVEYYRQKQADHKERLTDRTNQTTVSKAEGAA